MNTKLAKYIILRLVFLTTCLMLMAWLAANVWADVYIDGSLGLFANGKPGPANVKYGEIGNRDYLPFGFYTQYNAGGWVQTDRGDGRKSSGFVSGQIGVEAERGVVLRLATGPAIISTPDSYLGGVFQFKDELFIGLKGYNDNTLGFRYTHFSSAGLEMPNQGREFGGIELTFGF